MVTKRQNRKDHNLSASFLIYSVFSNRNEISLFSSKVYDTLSDYMNNDRKKSSGAHARWWVIAIFQLTEVNIKANPPCFQFERAQGCTKWHHKLCAERMRIANVKNHRKQYLLDKCIKTKNIWQKNVRSVPGSSLDTVITRNCMLHVPGCKYVFFSFQPWWFYPYTRISYQSNWWKNHRCLLHEWGQSVSSIHLIVSHKNGLLILIVFNTFFARRAELY